MRAEVTVSSPVARSPRVMQLAGMFDLPLEEKASLSWSADLPAEEREWHVGLVTGPSGSGKTTLARHLWADHIAGRGEWSADRALVDDFPAAMSIRDITGLLSAVGLASPPAWVRPFATLSNGEAFRASIARALAESAGLVVVDEFSSVVDRQVAKVASHAVQKAVRRGGRQFVAVTCHYDVTEWLQPDWVYDVAAGEFSWRPVQRHPPVGLEVHVADRSLWKVFARHHYLSGELHRGAQCFAAYADGRPVAFTSYLHFPHPRTANLKMAHRIVVLPDWQGLGIAGRLSEWQGEHLAAQGFRYRITTAHPAFIHYMAASPRWRAMTRQKVLATRSTDSALRRRSLNVRGLTTRTFEYTRVSAVPGSAAPTPSRRALASRG